MKKLFFTQKGMPSQWNNNDLIFGEGQTRGGAVVHRDRLSFLIENGIYVLNHVQMDGGGIYLLNCHNGAIQNNVFFLNKAKWGGAIYLEKCSDVHIRNNIFICNFAMRDGGAISLSNCSHIALQNNLFFMNCAFRSFPRIDAHNCKHIIIGYK